MSVPGATPFIAAFPYAPNLMRMPRKRLTRASGYRYGLKRAESGDRAEIIAPSGGCLPAVYFIRNLQALVNRERRGGGAAALAWALFVAIAVGCASPLRSQGPGDASSGAMGERRPAAIKRITAGVRGDLPTLNHFANRATSIFTVPGGLEVQMLTNSGLGILDDRGTLRPQLGEQIPSIENGAWKLLPDGRMETTWTIRDGVQWHDGTPLTSDDLVFSATVVSDKALAVFRNVAYDAIERVDTVDLRTVMVTWNKPYIDADSMFTPELGTVMPKHLLERPYLADKDTFLQIPYWSESFVGTGPFRLREFARGSHLVLEANDLYVLGRPNVDQIEVRFIPDTNTLSASLLAGAIELTLGRSLTIEEGVDIAERWRDGRVGIDLANWVVMYPQFINPSPPALADARFRRALTHAIDRQQLVDTLEAGRTSVADAFLNPEEPEYRQIESAIVRYAYNPVAAAQLVEALGYTRAPDGAFRDSADRNLAVETRVTSNNALSQKATFSVADFWRKLGIDVETVVVPAQRTQDREYMSTFPGFMVYRQSSTLTFLPNRHSSQAPIPETRFVGQNYSRYMDSAFDALIERYYVTIPQPERSQILGTIVHTMTEQALLLGLFYDGTSAFIGNRLESVTIKQQGWNGQDWDVRS